MEISKRLAKQDSVAKFFFLLFWLLKPFYIRASGTIQIGDICLVIAVALILLRGYIRINLIDVKFYIFFGFVLLVNLIYFIKLDDFIFLKSTLFFLFNLLAIYGFRELINDDYFLYKLDKVLKLNLLIQLFLYLLDLGRWHSEGRYMGTYNDPNQLGFAILTTYCLIYCINRKLNIKGKWIFFIIASFMIYVTSSMGMLLGMLILFVCEQYFRISVVKKEYKLVYTFYLMFLTIGLLLIASMGILAISGNLKGNFYIFDRLLYKLDKGDTFLESFIIDRFLYPIVNAPKYLLLGSGEGLMIRFAPKEGEPHSTWLSICFYYGIIPFLFLLSWVKDNLRKIDYYVIPVYACVFIEALTLINHRQPSFWLLIVLGSVLTRKKREDNFISNNYEKQNLVIKNERNKIQHNNSNI